MTIDPVIAALRELDKIDAYLALAREPHWSYRNAITTNKQNIRSAVAAARAALAAPMAAPEQDAYTVAAGLWRAALVGLCQGQSTTFDTPDKAADNVRARLRHSNPASMHHRDAAAPNAAPEQGESLMRISQDPSGMMWIYIDGGTDAGGKLVHGAAIPVPPSDWATARLHVERLSAAAPMAASAAPDREELLGDAIRALIQGNIKCSDDLPPEKRPVNVSARRAFGAVYDLLATRPTSPQAAPEPSTKQELIGFLGDAPAGARRLDQRT